VKLKKEWLIGGADSTVAVENIPEKFFWQGLLPKFKESKKLLVRKFTGIDRVDFEWQKNAGAKQTSYFMIISICLMFIVSLLSGLWLRIKDNDAVAVMAIVPITMVATFAAVAALTAAILTTTTLITLCGLLAFILAIVAAIGGVTTGLRQDFKGSVELSKISILLLTAAISFLTQSWFIFGILFGIEVVIFLTARYLKIKSALPNRRHGRKVKNSSSSRGRFRELFIFYRSYSSVIPAEVYPRV
jgi:hypothetical protein